MRQNKKQKVEIKPNSLVKFDFDSLPKQHVNAYPFSTYDRFVYLGDIVQMPGHCIVVNTITGQVHCCYHTDNFVLSEENTNKEN